MLILFIIYFYFSLSAPLDVGLMHNVSCMSGAAVILTLLVHNVHVD